MSTQTTQTTHTSPADPLHYLSDIHARIEQAVDKLAHYVNWKHGALLTEVEEIDLRSALDFLRRALPIHAQDEEESLFPRIRASGNPDAWVAIPTLSSLEVERKSVQPVYAEVDEMFRKWIREQSLTFPDIWRLRRLTKDLKAAYTHHVQIEENEVFPLAEKVLCATCKSGMTHEMLERRGLEEAVGSRQ
jgi:hemerythrin-like domain-containing protein